MMEGWQACFIVLIVDLASGTDSAVNSKYKVKQIDFCPDQGYFFKRDPSPNTTGPGPCFLCFCQDNGTTATCWEQVSSRCDVEKFQPHQVERLPRMRRSISLSDIFFRDASRDFFKKRLPEQCEPFESSFSDGCPPADWCIGCTVCDCDANGRWDCHILSFCDGQEKKKKVKSNRVPKRRSEAKNNPATSTTTRPAKRIVKKFLQAKHVNRTQIKSNIVNQPPKQQAIRQLKKVYRPRIQPQKIMVKKPQPQNPQLKKIQRRKPQPQKLQPQPQKLQPQPQKQQPRKQQPQPQKQQPQKTQPQKSEQRKPHDNESKVNNSKLKVIKGGVSRKTLALQERKAKLRKMINGNVNDTVELGQKVVKQVMSAVHKLLKKEIQKINETRFQRSVNFTDGKGCGGTNKIVKENNNVKSKKKRTHRKKSYTIENNFYGRFKREILNESLAEIENVTLKTSLPEHYSANSVNGTVKQENSLSTKSSVDVTLENFTSTLQKNYYYKYSINNDTNTMTTIRSVKKLTNLNKHDTFFSFAIPFESGSNTSSNKIYNKTVGPINPLFNDLKFTKWFIIKIKNDKQKKLVERLVLPKSKIFEDIKTTENASIESKLQRKEMIYRTTKKQNFHNFVTRNYNRPSMFPETLLIKNETALTGLRNTLQNLLRELNKNNTVRQNLVSKVNIMKYVKRFFHKIFSKKTPRADKVNGIGSKEDHTLQILCKNIGPCKINRKNRFLLKYKLKQLNKETRTILRSITIIKGLLHLLELPSHDGPGHNKSSSYKNNIRKLSTILRDNYNIAEVNAPLTNTAETQIKNIKKNTQVFIESISKFAEILNKTITLIRPNSENDRPIHFFSKQDETKKAFQRIRKILSQYNKIQNTFMTRMYELIHGEENRMATTEIIKKQTNRKENCTDKVIDKYSKNIIKNLKKLKSLAKALSSKRKKRHLMGMDNTLEYLLTLMEYMIKQKQPLHTVQVNDGIDSLLDAIKNAPDIKPFNMKYQEEVTTSKPVLSETEFVSELFSDSNSESNRISNEEKQLTKDNISSDGNIWIVQQNTENAFDVTPKNYFRTFNDKPLMGIGIENETTVKHVSEKRSQEETEKVGFDKFESSIDENKKFEVYAENIDDDGNGDGTDIALAVIPNIRETSTESAKEKNKSSISIPVTRVRSTTQSKDSSSESQDSSSDSKKAKLDWIEETFDREIKEFNALNSSYPSSTTESTLPFTMTVKYIKNTDNEISITAEVEDTVRSKKNSTNVLKPDNIMYKKEIEFLNSLDYGTDKSDYEDKDSKDDAKSNGTDKLDYEDKDSRGDAKANDTKLDDEFPAYYV